MSNNIKESLCRVVVFFFSFLVWKVLNSDATFVECSIWSLCACYQLSPLIKQLKMKLLTIAFALLTLSAHCQQFYAGLDFGAGVILHQTNGTISGHGGYMVQTEHVNFYTEVNATYGTRNRGQISIVAGSTVFTQHVVLMGGISTEQKTFMGKYQMEVKGTTAPCGALYYHWKAVDAGMFAVIRATPGTWMVGVGVGRNLIR